MSDDIKQTERQLAIKTGVAKRLAKEVTTYESELSVQQRIVDALVNLPEADRGAEWEYEVRNANKVLKDCDQMILPARERFNRAHEALEDLLETTSTIPEVQSSTEYANAKTVVSETKGRLASSTSAR